MWGTKLLYAAVVINTTLKAGTFSYTTGLPIVSDWDDFIEQQVSETASPVFSRIGLKKAKNKKIVSLLFLLFDSTRRRIILTRPFDKESF